MTHKTTAEAVRLTQEIITRFWKYDYKYGVRYFADDITLIGSL